MMKLVLEQEKKHKEKKQSEEEQQKGINLYIPYVFDNVSKETMREKLTRFGKIKAIDFVAKVDKKNINYNSAYIYFDSWYLTAENNKIQAQIKQYTKSQNKLQSFKMKYDGHLHWILLENTSPSAYPKQERKVVINLNEATLHHDRTATPVPLEFGLKTLAPAPPLTPAGPTPEQIMSHLLPLTTTRSTNKKIVSIDDLIESKKAHPQQVELDKLFDAELQRNVAVVEMMRLKEQEEQEEQEEEQEEQEEEQEEQEEDEEE